MKICIQRDWSGIFLNITFYEKVGDKYHVITKDGIKIFGIEEHGEPTLKIESRRARELFLSMKEQLENHGIQTNQESKNAGLLEATKYHLEDLRKLVFKND